MVLTRIVLVVTGDNGLGYKGVTSVLNWKIVVNRIK